jgi:hypothetical protein
MNNRARRFLAQSRNMKYAWPTLLTWLATGGRKQMATITFRALLRLSSTYKSGDSIPLALAGNQALAVDAVFEIG